ncbi:ATPase [Mycobacterium botniense]|uniref:ATPase n=1 Tax=Mycobacterium botniense TaxID=84962 RepID=A0A7I9XXA1_9MYCO|nr:ATPase [Mycobacterium botniense]GFG74377.1 hypothetical protein MBOT_17420 [Mycobacterium botniense]
MRAVLATMLVVGGAVAPVAAMAVHADPETCPAVCDRIPGSAWIPARDVPLNAVYRWPALAAAAVAVTGTTPRFRFEELCATPTPPQDPRQYAVAARAAVANPDGQWQLQAQVLHWRGDTARGGQAAASVFRNAAAALQACQPGTSPPITLEQTDRLVAVVGGPVVLHTYLLAHPASSTVSELALWSSDPPQVPWPLTADTQILDAMTAPLCTAYIASCP